MAPIPFACYGTSVELADKINACMQPDYELVHGCFSLDAATTELPDSFAGNLAKADAAREPIGSNAKVPLDQRRAPRFLCIGGSIPDEHWDTVKAAIVSKAPGACLIAIRKKFVIEEGITPDMSLDDKAVRISRILRRKAVEKGVAA